MCYFFDNIFFSSHKNVLVVSETWSGRIRIYLAAWIRIRNSGLQDYLQIHNTA